MRPRVISLVVLLAMLPALSSGPALAQSATDTTQSTVYRLTAKSLFEQGCFAPCLCPVLIADGIVGTFQLTPAGSDPLFTVYDITDVNWLVRIGDTDRRITGSGTYRIGGEFALTHQLQLDLKVGDADVQRFDSGLIVGGSDFPAINITIAVNKMICNDTVITVSALPLPPAQIARYSIPGSSYLEGCFGPCDCAVSSKPVVGRFGLANVGAIGGVVAFAVLDVHWSVLNPGTTIIADGIPVTGLGIYELSAAPGSQRMTLDLTLNGKGPQRFDSGWVPGGGYPRRIDIRVAANGFACFDQVFDLHARQIRPVALLPAVRLPGDEREPRSWRKPIAGP